MLIDLAERHAGKTFSCIEIDSYEVLNQGYAIGENN